MIVFGFEVRLRFPLWVDRVRPYWCPECARHRGLSPRGRCERCYGLLRRVAAMSGYVDLFAGAGGWDVAARDLGIDPLGIEWDADACATREAAGHRTLRADVSELDPEDFAPCVGLIGSPPCQAWSMAGKRAGAVDVEHCIQAAYDLADGRDTRADHRVACTDERSILVVEPLRWALALRPEWVALEQVPPVLDYWRLTATLLERVGYRCWAGVLEAERYGVPQTRERAILMASLSGQPHPPRATHQRFVSGEPARRDVTLEGEVLPWVSMAEALGWGMTERPSVTVAAASDGPHALDGGSGSRAAVERERERSVDTGWRGARECLSATATAAPSPRASRPR